MRIFSINNIPVFMQRIRSCTGNVHYEDRNGNYKDLKALAAQLESITRQSRAFMPPASSTSITKRTLLPRKF